MGAGRTLMPPGEARKNDALMVYGACRPQPFVMAYVQQRTEVVHGPACRPGKEIFMQRCSEDGVPVVARRGGGGTVVLSPGMVVPIVVAPRPAGDVRAIYRLVQGAMREALWARWNGDIEQQGISDLAVDNTKVGGSSLYLPRSPRLFCYQSSLMVSSDRGLIDRYLKHPPREPDYRRRRPHSTFCTTLREVGCPLSTADIADIFNSSLPGLLRSA